MHVNAKKMAFLGLLLAICEILLVLSKVIDVSTLFFLAAASFCTGIAVREYGISMGFGFFLASEILGLILAPDKLYCVTYGIMAFYIWGSDAVWNKMTKKDANKNWTKQFWIVKYVLFNIMYIPAVLFLPQLFYSGTYHTGVKIALIAAGQIILFVFDKAYCYFQSAIWGKYRKFLEK